MPSTAAASISPTLPVSVSVDGASDQLRVSTVLVRGLADVMRQRFQMSVGASLGSIDDICDEPEERMFPFAELRALLADAVRKTGEPALGLHWGLHARASSFGLMTPLISYAPTLRHALALVSQFHALISDETGLKLEERMGVARLYYDLPPGMSTVELTWIEMMLAGLVRMLGEFGCTSKDIQAVCFEYARPRHYAAYAAAFGGTERFSQVFTGIELTTEALDRPHPHRHMELQALMVAEAERRLERQRTPRGFSERVRTLLSHARPNQIPDMHRIARRLGVSERSLRRRLQDEGVSYRELVQSFLHSAACVLLRNQNLTLQEVADALGFADSTAFHRAFRRWSNVTPAEYRDSRSGNHSGATLTSPPLRP